MRGCWSAVATTTTGSDGSFRLGTDEPGPYLLTSPENNGTVDGDLIGVHQEIPAFDGSDTITVISSTETLMP